MRLMYVPIIYFDDCFDDAYLAENYLPQSYSLCGPLI